MKILLSILFPLSLLAQQAQFGNSGKALLPDSTVTPRAVRTTDAKAICSEKFTTRDERHTTLAMKKQVCAEYGIKKCPDRSMEIDHLVSLELGGADRIENLWPEPENPEPGFRAKDKVEGALHRMVCSGALTLIEAQRCIASDWFGCAKKHGILDEKGDYIPDSKRDNGKKH